MAEAGAQQVLEWLSGVPGWLAVLLVVAVVLAEPALIVGMVLPSVGAAVSLGFLSSLGVVPLAGAVVAVALAAVVGDGLAFRSGRDGGGRGHRLAGSAHAARLGADRSVVRADRPLGDLEIPLPSSLLEVAC